MRTRTLFAALAGLSAAAGCLDLPIDEWDGTARRARRPAPTMVAVPSGDTHIYVREPVYYAGPIYTESTYVRRRGPATFNVSGTGSYRGIDYHVGYGGGPGGYGGYGGYGQAGGTRGNTSWNASWGYPAYAGGYGCGGTNSYGIYGNGNGPAGASEPSRFSVYR